MFETIAEAILLVVLVIFFFLRSLRATIIPIVTIPVSLVGAFGLMYAFGFTINTLTLLAMVLAIGLVVDDAIVVLENIYRHIEAGMERVAAAIKGVKEIGFAVVAMTLTLTSVFAPLAFATGRTGRLFIEFALTLAGAVLVSGFVALTLSPMMCCKLLKHEEKHGRVFTMIEGWINGLTQRLCAIACMAARAALDRRGRLVRHRRRCAAVSSRCCVGAGADRGSRRGLRPHAVAAGFDAEYTADQLRPIEEFYSKIPEAAAYTAISGFPTVVDGNAVLRLKPWEERNASSRRSPRVESASCRRCPGRSPSRSIRRRSGSRSARRRSST